MKTLASLGLLAAIAFLVVLTIAGFRPGAYVLITIAVFALLFNLGSPRRKKAS